MTGSIRGCSVKFLICFIILTEGRTKYELQYKLLPRKYNFPKASVECKRKGYFLPFVKSNLTKLQNVMLSNRINNIWISAKIQGMDAWRWVDNTSSRDILTDGSFWDEKSGQCGVIDVPRDKLRAHSCSDQHTCFVCSFTGMAGNCQGFKHCFYKTGSLTLAVGNETVSWFVARKYCKKHGGDLAVINTEDKRSTLRDHLTESTKDIVMGCKNYYIGIRKDHWVSIIHDKVIPVDLHLWSNNEPGRFQCAELCVGKGKFALKTRGCMNPNNVLCLTYADEIKPSTKSVNEDCFEEKKALKKSNAIIKHSKSKINKLAGMEPYYISFLVLFGLIIVIIVLAFIYRRKKLQDYKIMAKRKKDDNTNNVHQKQSEGGLEGKNLINDQR